MAKNISWLGATYTGVPAITLPQQGGGTARFDDASVTTAAAGDVAQGKIFLASDGTPTEGTNSGGGGVTVTDVPNATGTTCVITSGGQPTPTETWEMIHEGNIGFYHDSNNDYPYCWVSALSSVTIATGSVWRITYSGTTYRCTAAYDTILATACIGNPKWAQGSDDGSDVPFIFENLGYGAWMGNLNAPNTDAQYYFKIERLVTD